MTTISETVRSQALQDSAYLSLQNAVMLGGVLHTLVLLLIIIISTVNP
jgi:hypothetical protein